MRQRAEVLSAAFVLLLLAAAVAPLPPAAATHEKADRYIVAGRVTNLTGVGLPSLTIEATVVGASTIVLRDVWTGVTNAEGYYRLEIQIYPRDPGSENDEGKELLVGINGTSVGRATFVAASPPPAGEDPAHEGWGYSYLDMELDRAGPAPQSNLPSGDLAPLALGGAAIAAAAALLFLPVRWRKRRAAARAAAQRDALTNLPGVGRATAEKLAGAGVTNIPQLAREKAPELAVKLGMSERDAKRLIEKAASRRKRRA